MSMINTCFRLFLLVISLQSVVACKYPNLSTGLLKNLDYPSLLEKRQDCVTCPANPPACPVCPAGQACQITSQSCTQCAQSLCIDSTSIGNLGTATPSNGPNTGAIAGGIVAAIVVVGCIVGGIFWYIRKKRQAARDMDLWLDKTTPSFEEKNEPGLHASAAFANAPVIIYCVFDLI